MVLTREEGWEGGTPFDVPCRETLPKRGTFSRLQVMKGQAEGISLVEINETVGESVIAVKGESVIAVKGPKKSKWHILWL